MEMPSSAIQPGSTSEDLESSLFSSVCFGISLICGWALTLSDVNTGRDFLDFGSSSRLGKSESSATEIRAIAKGAGRTVQGPGDGYRLAQGIFKLILLMVQVLRSFDSESTVRSLFQLPALRLQVIIFSRGSHSHVTQISFSPGRFQVFFNRCIGVEIAGELKQNQSVTFCRQQTRIIHLAHILGTRRRRPGMNTPLAEAAEFNIS
jgi:hypothetical protein